MSDERLKVSPAVLLRTDEPAKQVVRFVNEQLHALRDWAPMRDDPHHVLVKDEDVEDGVPYQDRLREEVERVLENLERTGSTAPPKHGGAKKHRKGG